MKEGTCVPSITLEYRAKIRKRISKSKKRRDLPKKMLNFIDS